MKRNWQKDLEKYEKFLKNIDVEKYAELRPRKTVEQDLPPDLIPLAIFYRHYWDSNEFKDYEEVFEIYWNEKFNPHIRNFIKKYFYGCSLMFVEEGFKARLYRTWMSVLTQFHFQYLWNTLFENKLISDWELDQMGIDAKVTIADKNVGLQVKKISYRREASHRRFTKRQQKHVDVVVEIPYLVVDTDELARKLESERTWESTKKECKKLITLFNENFVKYDNGFVIFKKEYLKQVYGTIEEKVRSSSKNEITYDEILPL